MMKLSRSECPNWLTENSAEWTRRWIRKVNTPTTKNNWDWYDVEGVATNQKLLPLLLVDTDYHCSYCDKRPIRVEEIDHFKPKVEFPNDAFDWENLFVVCKDCNFLKPIPSPKRYLKIAEPIKIAELIGEVSSLGSIHQSKSATASP
jgi:5-methylcytosine-specific restriction endonuclease McrA